MSQPGDPYDIAGAEDQTVQDVRQGFTEFRSSYYQDEGWMAQADGPKTAIFAIQGWTDDLFPAVESFRQFKYLKRLDPRWPVQIALGDIGHSRGQNKPATWHRLNPQAFGFLQANINGSHEQTTTISSEPTICANDGDSANNDKAASQLTATTPEGLSGGALTIGYSRSGATNNPLGALDPNGPSTDAIFGSAVDALRGVSGPCRSAVSTEATGGYTAYSDPLPNATTYVGLGYVTVNYKLAGVTAELNARVFDVPPGAEGQPDKQLLMTRGTYRIDTPFYDTPAGKIKLPLYGNHWPLAPGHKIRLDLTQVDQSTYRPSNLPSKITFSGPTLTLPTRSSGDRTLGGQ